MPRARKGARLWLRPTRRRGGRLVANAVWIIVDGKRHIATGCLKGQAREAEKRLAAYIAEKYSPLATPETSITSMSPTYCRSTWKIANSEWRISQSLSGALAGSTTTGAARCCPRSRRPSAGRMFKSVVSAAVLVLTSRPSAPRSIIMPSRTCTTGPCGSRCRPRALRGIDGLHAASGQVDLGVLAVP